jgi:hypothetical protein
VAPKCDKNIHYNHSSDIRTQYLRDPTQTSKKFEEIPINSTKYIENNKVSTDSDTMRFMALKRDENYYYKHSSDTRTTYLRDPTKISKKFEKIPINSMKIVENNKLSMDFNAMCFVVPKCIENIYSECSITV